MSAVGSRSHHYSAQSSSTNASNPRRLSTVPYANSPVNTRFSDRRLSVAREQFRSPSRNDDQSTEMITIALAKAQNAVLLDQRNNVTAALDGYSQCCAILAEVIAKETDSDDITRLRQIHDTYSVRMHVLSTMQLEPNPLIREMPPLPTQADIQDFEDEDDEEEILSSFRLTRPQLSEPPPVPDRFSSIRSLTIRPDLHRSSSSRDSTGISRHPPSARKAHTRISSFTRTHSKQASVSSLEQISTPSSGSTFRPTSKKEAVLLRDMVDEEMDDAAFLERITRGFASDEEMLEDETAQPSTSPTGSSIHHQPKKPSEGFVFEQIPSMIRTESEDFVLPSPRSAPRQPSPVPKPKHDRARNTSSPLPQAVVTTPRPSSAKKTLSIGGSQPMAKSLSANNAIPNSDEFIVPGNPDAAPAVPPKIKKRPHLIRVVSEQTMRTNSGVRISTFDLSPGSPPSTGSILTPGTTTSSLYTDIPSAKNLIVHDREGAVGPEDPPDDPYLRPFWLMRALALSIKNQKGVYINSRLFIPQGVWVFKGVKLKAIEEKINCFHSMALAVRQVLDTDYRNFSLLVQVCPFCENELIRRKLQILKERWRVCSKTYCESWTAVSRMDQMERMEITGQ